MARKPKSWSVLDLKNAMKDMKDGKSLRSASTKYGIPRATLQRRKKTWNESEMKPGKKCVFTAEQEMYLFNHLVSMANTFHGLTPFQVRKLAYELAAKLKIKHPPSWRRNLAGRDWLYGFLARHPQLSTRKAEGTSINRVTSFNQEYLRRFYNNLFILLTKYKIPPERIFNMDESGFTTVQVNSFMFIRSSYCFNFFQLFKKQFVIILTGCCKSVD